jgi:alpha-galactosidase
MNIGTSAPLPALVFLLALMFPRAARPDTICNAPPRPAVMESGRWHIVYDLANGVADILFDGKLLLGHVHAEAQLPRTVSSMDYSRRTLSRRRVKDRLGSGMEFQVESVNSDADKMIQTFWFYDNADYFLTRMQIIRKEGAASNFMAPLVARDPASLFPPDGNRALFVPFDNDKWIRYDAIPFGDRVTSCEVSAFYNTATRQGLVAGSIDHDTWKTGVQSTTASGTINDLEIFGGLTSTTTRDTLAHGKVTGQTIQSPRIFVGFFSDWRTGLETYARANAAVAPPRPWKGGVPFGWNSWGKLQFNISFQKAMEVSDFFAKELQPRHFENNKTVYIGLDSGWPKFTDGELKRFVDHCKANHQEAGIYFAPFADFKGQEDAVVEGSSYHYKDIYLYANGQKQRIDGAAALDPTHPGTRARIKNAVKRFKEFGFKYLKADFMVHGSLEADHFHDPRVTTGLQAYNAGLRFLNQTMGRNMYLNLAISPLFPSQYANSRRIACDAWGDIGKIEYTLNALTYGWWLNSVYDYNDPDHVVLGGFSDGENRARVTSAVVTGLFLSGDDFSRAGEADGKEKARRFLTNADIDSLGRIGKSFRPVEGDTGDHAANMFFYENRKSFYLAAFNYALTETNLPVSFGRIGLGATAPLYAKELWSGQITRVSSPMTIHVPSADAVVYQFYKDGQRPK